MGIQDIGCEINANEKKKKKRKINGCCHVGKSLNR